MPTKLLFVACCATLTTSIYADTLTKWFKFSENPITVAVSSAKPCKVAVDGKLQAWTSGGNQKSYFRLVGGNGWRMTTFTSESTPHGIDVTYVKANEVADSEISDIVLGSAKFVCDKKHYWLYNLKDRDNLVFKSNGKYRGFPSASIYCRKPGTIKVIWGGREEVLVCEKPGYAPFSPVALTDTDSIKFAVECGLFEISGVSFTTVSDKATDAMSFTSNDAQLNNAFIKAKRICDRQTMESTIKTGLGLKSIDEKTKTVTIDPTIRNGVLFCGVKIPVKDGILDIRWMRDNVSEMASVSQTLPTGWKLIRDFDMQAECQRLCDLAIAEGMEGGMQFCAYKNGKKIVDVFAGNFSTNVGAKAVKSDTLFPIFSTEKPLLATACHRAVERGIMDYDKPLCTWWPELKGDGKERLTLRETLGYRTCLPGGAPGGKNNPISKTPLTDLELTDWDRVCRVAAADKPNGVPGTVQAYLPYAYAWMVGHPLEVAMKKPLKQILDEEVLIPSGIEKDFYFVVPRDEYPRIATMFSGQFVENMNEDWARQAMMPSAWAVSSAEALCKFYNRLCGYDGKAPLISKKTLDEALKPCRHESDPLPSAKSMKRDWYMLFGMGYGLWGESERIDRVFGHGGAGGSEALVDRDNELIVAFTTNIPRGCLELRDQLYEVVGLRWRYWNDNVSIQDLQMTTSSGGNYGAGITSR